MSEIINMDDYRPAISIQVPGVIHVYPVAYFESLIKGEDVEPLPPDVLQAILKDWLEHLP